MVIIRKDLLGMYTELLQGDILINSDRNAAGKILKAGLRKLAAEVWAERNGSPKAKL